MRMSPRILAAHAAPTAPDPVPEVERLGELLYRRDRIIALLARADATDDDAGEAVRTDGAPTAAEPTEADVAELVLYAEALDRAGYITWPVRERSQERYVVRRWVVPVLSVMGLEYCLLDPPRASVLLKHPIPWQTTALFEGALAVPFVPLLYLFFRGWVSGVEPSWVIASVCIFLSSLLMFAVAKFSPPWDRVRHWIHWGPMEPEGWQPWTPGDRGVSAGAVTRALGRLVLDGLARLEAADPTRDALVVLRARLSPAAALPPRLP